MKIKKEAKIGFVITLAIFLLFWGMNYLKGKNILKRKNIYYVVYDKIEGLQVTAPVLINGFKVGLVDDVYLNESDINQITVELAINKNIKIPENSVASIFSSDLMGTKSIKIISSNSDLRHKEGDTLIPAVEADLTEQVSIQMLPLKHKAEDLMKDMQEAIEIIKYVFNENTRNNLDKSFESIKLTIYNLENTSLTLDTLLKTEKVKLSQIFSNIESISTNLKNNNAEIKHALANFSSISDSIAQANLKSTINNIQSTFIQLAAITEKINNGEGSIGQLVNNDTLYYNIEAATLNLDALIKDIKLNPKKYVHFSIVDKGKTVYISEEGKIVEKNNK